MTHPTHARLMLAGMDSDDIAWALGYMTAGQLAVLCQVNEATVSAWRRRSIGPVSARIGGQWVYARDDVAQWIDSRKNVRDASDVDESPVVTTKPRQRNSRAHLL